MKFSVVIPLYNGANFIEATLDTVLAQTYTDYEIVMVNDGSPDNIGEVVKRYMADHYDIKFVYLEQENRGLGGARNTAMRHTSGDVIAILDQDDIWYPNKLEKVAHLYKEKPEVDIICHSQNVRKNGEVIRVFRPGPNGEDVYRKLLFVENMLSTSAVTFRKKAIDEIGYF
ncbi:MAG: glycosyltransferase family 2 protein, partial [Candidatus Omnitrophota bacterium]